MSYQQERFTAIADKIREKTGVADLIKPSEFVNKIDEVYEAGKTQRESEWWDNLQQGGERTDYSYAFCNSAHTVLNPLYTINANIVMYMFMNCTKLEDAGNIVINITSQKPNMMYVCANCISMTKAPVFNFVSVPIVKTYTSMYAGCNSLESACVYWGDGTADAITQRSSCQNMFYRCTNLKNIDFGSEETGSPIYLDLSYAKALTADSCQSLLTSLKTIDKTLAESEGSVHEITISPETYVLLETDTPDILTGFAEKGWTILTKERAEESEE